MRPLVVIAALDGQALTECLATISDELRDDVLIVDNSEEGFFGRHSAMLYRPTPHEHARDLRPRYNLGVARSMNVGAEAMRAGRYDSLMWVSTSMRFADDGGLRLIEAAQGHEVGAIGLPACLHACIITAHAFDLVGLWDENFASGYHEDQDWRYRLHLAGLEWPTVEIGGSALDGQAYNVLRKLNPGRTVINFDAHKEYYTRKWNGCPPVAPETYEHPFNDPSFSLDYWPRCTREELIDRYGLGL